MRVHHVEQVMHGLCALEPPPLASLDLAQIDVERLRHLLWNGHRQMRWSPRGAHRVLQVRAAVLDGRFGHQALQLAA